VNPEDIKKIEAYLQRLLNPAIKLTTRPRVTDSVEVSVNGEHIALVYRIEDEGEVSYELQMAILEDDLEG
jgi:hypothetical protein